MAKETSFFNGTGGLVAGAVSAAVLIVAALLVYQRVNAPDPVGAADVAVATPQAAPEITPEITPDAEVAAGTPDPVGDPVTPALPAPRFDVIYVNPDGTGTLAGRAAPGEPVAVLLDGAEIDRAIADGQGGFVVLLDLAPSDQPRTLDLLADPDGSSPRAAAETRIIGPTTAPVIIAQADPVAEVASGIASDPQPADVGPAPTETTDPAPDSASPTPEAPIAAIPAPPSDPVPTPTDPAQAPTGGATPTPETPAPADPIAPAILSADADGVRVLQPAALPDTPPEVMATVALDTITYDPGGDVLLGGRAQAGGFVRVYIDNQPVTTSPISESGDWRTDLPQVDTGVYTLRVDEVDAQGTVTSRIETPFLREEPATVAAAMAEETSAEGFRVAVKTVQPGATLWAIARERYGTGVMYVQVFEANRDRIRDPDLIYPGQVFVLPDDAQ